MRVVVDRERCIGSGQCEVLAPEVFEVGDDGVVTVLQPQPGAEDEAAVRDAVAQCPTAALSLAE
ncbi:ferredoxin [Geodermatophilus sp. SYSU D00697]